MLPTLVFRRRQFACGRNRCLRLRWRRVSRGQSVFHRQITTHRRFLFGREHGLVGEDFSDIETAIGHAVIVAYAITRRRGVVIVHDDPEQHVLGNGRAVEGHPGQHNAIPGYGEWRAVSPEPTIVSPGIVAGRPSFDATQKAACAAPLRRGGTHHHILFFREESSATSQPALPELHGGFLLDLVGCTHHRAGSRRRMMGIARQIIPSLNYAIVVGCDADRRIIPADQALAHRWLRRRRRRACIRHDGVETLHLGRPESVVGVAGGEGEIIVRSRLQAGGSVAECLGRDIGESA